MIRYGMLLALLVPSGAPEITFASPPKAARGESGVEVAFVLSAPSDVEVSITDAKGRVVRHLAAGALGAKNPPPPPLRPGLDQKLTWDGKDDAGREAAGGPFKAVVRAGMSVRFGRMIGGSPYTGSVVSMPYRAPVNGLVADGSGRLFVKMMSSIGSHGNSGMWPWHLREFDRRGEYRQTLLPYPASTPPEKAQGFFSVPAPGGRLTPSTQTSLYPVFYRLGNELLPRMSEGQIVFVHSEARQMSFLAVDGSNRVRTVPLWPEKSKLKCPVWLDFQVALSPDGRIAYVSNVAGTAYDGKKPADVDPAWPQGRVYRLDLSKAGTEPEPFFDLKLPEKDDYWMPSAWDKKTAASGIDTDAKGHVLVGDLVNQEVVEIAPDGRRLSATKVPWPDKVLVSRKTGALYVVSRKVSRGALPPATLFKIEGRGDSAKVVAELALKGTVGGAMTIDEGGDVPVLWLAGNESETEKRGETLLRVEDRGTSFAAGADRLLNRDPSAISFVGYMDVDREAETVYVTASGSAVWRFQGETGEGCPIPIKAVDLAVGPGGTIYAWGLGGYEGPIARYGRDLSPQATFGKLYGRAGRGQSVCGMDVDARGRVYATFGTNECHVRVYDEKGELVDFPRREKDVPAAITGVTGYGGSLRVDAEGNLYLLQAGVPKGFPVPPGFEKDEAFRQALGTIYKFPPAGGEIETRNGSVVSVKGAIATYPGCGPVSRWNAVGSCACTKPRFDVDDYGRLYVPNAITFTVSVRDNADNEIARFGSYGNYDASGPEIPLGWPVTAGASDRFIYVGDALNHRVVRADKRFALEASVDLPAR
jgi:DNA-binding beta-propeller fold protein YncE